MNDSERDKIHQRTAKRLHGQSGLAVTVQGLEELRSKALSRTQGTAQSRRKAAETYRALTGTRV